MAVRWRSVAHSGGALTSRERQSDVTATSKGGAVRKKLCGWRDGHPRWSVIAPWHSTALRGILHGSAWQSAASAAPSAVIGGHQSLSVVNLSRSVPFSAIQWRHRISPEGLRSRRYRRRRRGRGGLARGAAGMRPPAIRDPRVAIGGHHGHGFSVVMAAHQRPSAAPREEGREEGKEQVQEESQGSR